MAAGKWIGGVLGFITAGPLGALAGYALGSLFEHGLDAVAPFSGCSYNLIDGTCIRESVGERKVKPVVRKASDVFERLVAAGRRLMTVIRHNEGGANKDLARFADQINSICDKWDR